MFSLGISLSLLALSLSQCSLHAGHYVANTNVQNNILRRGERDISYDAAYAQYYYQPYPIQYNLSNYQGKSKKN